MKAVRWAYFTALAVCLVAGLYTGTRAYYIAFFALLFAVLLALAINVWTFYAFTYRQELRQKVCVKGEWTELLVVIKNERPVPLSLMEVHVEVPSVRENVNLVFGLAPFSGREFTIPVATPYRGCFRVGMTIMKITDVFGLITLRFDLRHLSYYRQSELVVLPRAEAPGAVSAQVADAKLLGGVYLRQIDAGESASGARLYRKGDALKRIHWKKTAQLGELIVRQYEPPERERALILVDDSLHRLTGEEALVYADTVCECAASIALHNLLQGRMVRLAVGGGAVAEYSVLPELNKLTRSLALAEFGAAAGGVRKAVEQICDGRESARSLFVITRESTYPLTKALERARLRFNAVTLVLVGGARAGGNIHTLYVDAGGDAARSLGSIG